MIYRINYYNCQLIIIVIKLYQSRMGAFSQRPNQCSKKLTLHHRKCEIKDDGDSSIQHIYY